MAIEKDMTQICVGLLCLKGRRQTVQLLVQKFEEGKEIDGALNKDNCVESFWVYLAEYWPHYLRDADMPINESSITELYTDSGLNGLWLTIF